MRLHGWLLFLIRRTLVSSIDRRAYIKMEEKRVGGKREREKRKERGRKNSFHIKGSAQLRWTTWCVQTNCTPDEFFFLSFFFHLMEYIH